MAVKKISYDGQVLIDLTTDTASAADVRTGKTFHASDGTVQTGTFAGGTDRTVSFIQRTYPFDTITTFDNITYIGSGAFCYYINSAYYLSFPSVTRIETYAFYHTSFSGLGFDKCATIGSHAFGYCATNGMTFPSVTTIGSYAFHSFYGTSISSGMFPNATIAGSSCFRSASYVTTMSLPNVTTASQYAFANMSRMKSVSLPKLAQATIGLFYQCYSLPSIYLPSASYVSGTAFAYCSYLKAVYLGSAMTKISSTYAFRNCLRLESLYLLASTVVTLAAANAFTSTPISTYTTTLGHNGSIFVPEGLLSSYKAAAVWSAFSARMVGLTSSQISALPIFS